MTMTTSSMPVTADFRGNRRLQVLAVIYGLIWIALAIDPQFREDWLLENLLVVAFVSLLILTYRRRPYSDLSYMLMFAFMILHAEGAHYTYAEHPFGFWLQDAMGFERNHYDRIVHFSFGLLLVYPIREWFVRSARPSGRWATFFAVIAVIAFSTVYELIEWAVAMIVDPVAGQAFLGTQGDVWDAQRDTGLASLGGVVGLAFRGTVNRLKSA